MLRKGGVGGGGIAQVGGEDTAQGGARTVRGLCAFIPACVTSESDRA